MAELDLTAAVEVVASALGDFDDDGRACTREPHDPYLCRAEAAVRAAAPLIERAVLERAAQRFDGQAKFWQKEYLDAPDGTEYERQAASAADTYVAVVEALREGGTDE